MLTVDFDRLGLQPGDRVIDMGCGAGRHAFEMFRRGADVIAFDQDGDELAGVLDLFGAMREAGEVPLGAEADIKQGDALSLPFADAEFDRVVASEVLEHIPADTDAIAELARVLRPGGTMAVTVPRWLPEKVCWALSASTPATSWSPSSRPPDWSTRAAATRTACTRRTGGSSARSASPRTSTRSCAPTTASWSGTS